MSAQDDTIIVFDTTLRDGEQSPGFGLNDRQKLEIARMLERLGVDVIEAGFPISSPGDFTAVQTISREIRGCRVCGLTRAVQKDIDTAVEALAGAARPRIHTGLGVSDVHLQHKLRLTREQALEKGVWAVRYARRFVAEVEYFTEDAGRADPTYLYQVLEAVIQAGAAVVNIPDTTGYASPDEWGALIKGIVEHVPNIDRAVISVHCHNDLGLATANALAGLRNGARQVECTVNGIGERAGNTSLEEVVMGVKTRADHYGLKTRIDTRLLYPISRMVSDLTGIAVQPNKAIVGSNAFAHSSGIHQDGVLKDRTTYEIIDPREVGVPESKIVLTARSGRHALRDRAQTLGFSLTDEELEKLYARFLELADRKKQVYDEDVLALIEQDFAQAPEAFKLVSLHTSAGTGVVPTATIRLEVQGEVKTDAATGNGPVDAIYKAIERVAKMECTLRDYQLRAITGGKEAQGEVTVEVEHQGRRMRAQGLSTDIIEASARAYVAALNRLVAGANAKKTLHGL
jgi:2-isopropylmalate synthase